jgi:hypothetical protein
MPFQELQRFELPPRFFAAVIIAKNGVPSGDDLE